MPVADAVGRGRTDVPASAVGSPARARASGPILVAQGTIDTDVPEVATDGMVTRMCTIGDHVQYTLYKGLDHNNLVAGSQAEVDAWIAARFAGGAASINCPR